jgi:CheY-like chemotaxis protein
VNPPVRPILLVEDNPDDVFLIEKAMAKVDLAKHLQIARDGVEAVGYLEGNGKHSDRDSFPLPSLLLLDLKLSKMSGLEILAWLKDRPELAGIPVVVLTSSNDVSDIRSAYSLGAFSYHVKPAGIQELVVLAKHLRECWLRLQAGEDDRGRPLPGAQPIPGA